MKRKLFYILSFCLIGNFTFSQAITYQNPEDFSVCQSSQFTATVINNLGAELTDLKVTIALPCNIDYVVSSVGGGTESDVSDLNQPIFDISNLLIGQSQEITISIKSNCDVVTCIDNGDTFRNTVIVNHATGSNQVVTDAYLIVTPLIVITDIEDPVLTGRLGETIDRKITIRNTRPGPVSSFTYKNEYQGGLVITTNAGTDVSSDPQILEINFDAFDFAGVGDGDAFFEINETIIIRESIFLDPCNNFPRTVKSTLSTEWGCDNEICPSPNAPSLTVIVIKENQDQGPILEFTGIAATSNCFCSDELVEQELIITNLSDTYSASDVNVEITEQFISFGIEEADITVITSTDSTTVPATFDEVFNQNCIPGLNAFKKFDLDIPFIGANEIVRLKWNVISCNEGPCNNAAHTWISRHRYIKDCTIPSDQFQFGNTVVHTPDLIDSDITVDEPFLVDGLVDTVRYEVTSDLLVINQGQVQLNIFIPCGANPLDPEWILGGNAPVSIESIDQQDFTQISLIYDLPFSSALNDLIFAYEYTCDLDCPFISCDDINDFACEDLCIKGNNVKSSFSSQLNFIVDDTCPDNCEISHCSLEEVIIFCEFPVCGDTVPGYLDYTFHLERINYGLADLDDDHQPDGTGAANPSDIQLDRIMVGDTVKFNYAGEVITREDDYQFENGYLDLKFSGFDGENISPTNFKQISAIGDPATGFIPYHNELTIVDKSTGQRYYALDITPEYAEDPTDIEFHLRYRYDIAIAGLQNYDTNIPIDFKYEKGDSVYLEAFHNLQYNFVSGARAFASLELEVKALSSLYNERPYTPFCTCHFSRLIIANVKDEISENFGLVIPNCGVESRLVTKYASFGTIADFFPNEYRAPVIMDAFKIPRIEGITLAEVILEFYIENGVQNDVDIPIPFSEVEDIVIDFDPLEDITGFHLIKKEDLPVESWDNDVVLHLKFSYTRDECDFTGLPTYHTRVARTYADPYPTELWDAQTEHRISIRGRPLYLKSIIELCDASSFSDEVSWNFALFNFKDANAVEQAPIGNPWISAVSPTNLLTDFVLTNSETGQIYTADNGIWNLDSMFYLDSINFTLTGLNNSCETEDINIYYGWNCGPYLDINDDVCLKEVLACSVISPPGVIDMVNETDPLIEALCAEMPYSEIEIFNAGLGAVYDLILEAQLPPGVTIVPGSSEVAYPISDPYVSVGDPTFVNGNPQWNITDLVVALNKGLPGVNSTPLDKLMFRFLTITDCDFISGTSIIYTIEAQQVCDLPTNSLSQIGPPMQIQGIDNDVTTNIQLSTMPIAPCDPTVTIEVGVNSTIPFGMADGLLCQLPASLSYVPGSCMSSFPICEPIIDGNTLRWQLDEGTTTGQISFELTGIIDEECGELLIPFYATTETEALCELSGKNCSIEVLTGSESIILDIEKPDFSIDQITITTSSNSSLFDINFDITNNGLENSQDISIYIYVDKDENGVQSTGDVLVSTSVFNDIIASGMTTNLTITDLMLNVSELCNLLLVIDQNSNCLCNDTTVPINVPISYPAFEQHTICSGDNFPLGLPMGDPNANYSWSNGAQISCTNCAETNFYFINDGFNPAQFTLVLSQIFDDNCIVQYEFIVTVQPELFILSADELICQGETAVFFASEGEMYNWEGTGIVDPNQQIQEVSPTVSGWYFVTITDDEGCENVDSTFLEVIDKPIANVGPDIMICNGAPVFLNAGESNPDFSYFWSPPDLFSDPEVFNPEYIGNVDATVAVTIVNQACSTSDTINIDFIDVIDLVISPDTTICEGQSVTLEISGAESYEWSPNFFDMCQNADCSIVTVSPTTNTTFVVIATMDDICLDTIEVTVNVIPDDNVITTDAFICQGDEISIFGELVSAPGLYCDTISLPSGCDAIECINLGFFAPTDPPTFDPSEIFLEEGSSVVLSPLETFSTYSWSPATGLSCTDCPNPDANPSVTTTYILTATDENGCSSNGQVTVNLSDECESGDLLIPDAFSPNFNDRNDLFRVANLSPNVSDVTIEVYNRWGEKVFSDNSNDGWDGTYKDRQAEEETYIYVIKTVCQSGAEKTYKGNVTLLR